MAGAVTLETGIIKVSLMKRAAKTSRRKRCSRNQRRAGFTLAELLVSVGILLVMLGLVGQVMNVTVQATGQATALTEVNRSLRILEQTLREDLKGVHNGSGVMVIQGNPINTYWTQDDADADEPKNPLDGYPHDADPERERNDIPDYVEPPRADLLMFFTQRQRTSYITYPAPSFSGTIPEAVHSNVQQVVYGHANLGDYELNDAGEYNFEAFPDSFPAYPALSPTPAENWHLARRVIHLLPDTTDSIAEWVSYNNTSADRLGPAVSNTIPMNPSEYRLLTGESDVVYNFNYDELVLKNSAGEPLFLPEIFDGQTMPFSRSFLDESPPAVLAERLGHYFIPFCASFKVEWTFDPRAAFVGGRLAEENQVFWIDLGALGNDDPPTLTKSNPLASIKRANQEAGDIGPAATDRAADLDNLMNQPLFDQNTAAPYSLGDRFGESPDPQWLGSGYDNGVSANFAAFVANRGGTTDAPVLDELFPTALRITVDVYDDAKRLARPIRYVMVIPVGS